MKSQSRDNGQQLSVAPRKVHTTRPGGLFLPALLAAPQGGRPRFLGRFSSGSM
jgi:hypothetical protein